MRRTSLRDPGGPGDAHSSREWIWRPRGVRAASSTPPPPAHSGGRARRSTWPTRPPSRRIRRTVPEARLIVVLRDPVDRAYSNWAHLWADGLETIDDFVAACAEEPRRRHGRVGAVLALPRDRPLRPPAAAPAHACSPARSSTSSGTWSWWTPRATTLDGVCRFLGVDEGAGQRGAGPQRGRVRPAHPLRQVLRDRLPPRRGRRAATSLPRCGEGQPPPPVADPAHTPAPARSCPRPSGRNWSTTSPTTSTSWRRRPAGTSGVAHLPRGGTYSVRRSWAPSRRLVS